MASWSVFDWIVIVGTAIIAMIGLWVAWADFEAMPLRSLTESEAYEVEELLAQVRTGHMTREQWNRLEELERKMEAW